MIPTGRRLGPYVVELDELGDEVITLEGPWSLPQNYRVREALYAIDNMRFHDRRDLAISRATLHAAVQMQREARLSWGEDFAKDPRRFSSTPRPRGES